MNTGLIDVKRAVADNAPVSFVYFRDGELWYATAFSEMFPVPVEDTQGAVFKNHDKAILFMRWMNKHNKNIKEAKECA